MRALPGWVTDNAESVRRECAPYRGMSVEQRAEILSSLLALAADQLAANENRERVIAWRDPLSPDTEAKLVMLRARAKARTRA